MPSADGSGKPCQSGPADNTLLLSPRVFGDIHDVMLEDEQIGRALARKANHVPIVVFDPAAHNFPIRQLDADSLLFLAQLFEVSSFLVGFVGRRSLASAPRSSLATRSERHIGILHTDPRTCHSL